MTYDEDPTRWTSSPDDAPELLRGAFRAARNEGPSRNQMRSLALKLAAASAGGAVAVGTVKAASAGQTLTTAASWSAGKIAAVVAIAGTLVTGGAVVWQAGTEPQPTVRTRVAVAPTAPSTLDEQLTGSPGEQARAELQPGTPRVEPAEGTPVVEKLSAAERSSPQAREAHPEQANGVRRTPSGGVVSKSVSAITKSGRAAGEKPARAQEPQRVAVEQRARAQEQSRAARTPEAHKQTSEKPSAHASELELLRRAQVALTGRPREAFQLTQEHRKLYPAGEFAQERDALAIQALMRTGDEDKARDLAAAFIRSYPSSPHAHRFREAMGLR